MNRIRRSVTFAVSNSRKVSEETETTKNRSQSLFLRRANSTLNSSQILGTRQVTDESVTPEELRIAVIGPGGVGKSCLVLQFTDHTYTEEYDPTIEEEYRSYKKVNGRTYLLDITDTPGQEEYVQLRDLQFRLSQGFLLVFSITDEKSFHEIKNIYEQVLKARRSNLICGILVGNKCDLAGERKVEFDTANQWAKERGMVYIESSAKMKTNVEDAFFELVRQVQRMSDLMVTRRLSVIERPTQCKHSSKNCIVM